MSGAQKRPRPAKKPNSKPSSRRTEQSPNYHASGGLLPRSRKKVYLPARLRWAAMSIQAMIDATHLEERRHFVEAASSDTTTTTNKIKISLSDTALHALALCHERFLQVLAFKLSAPACANDNNATQDADQSQRATVVRSYVQVRDVANSLDALGLSHLFEAAQADILANQNSATATQPSRKDKRKTSRRSKKKIEWSASELEEQERLLAQSKEKFEKNTATKNIS